MNDENSVEIYRQRYETFRHLDKLRWQMLQILIAVASITALTLRATNIETEWWFAGAVGITLLIIGYVMIKIGQGIRRNGKVLKKWGAKLGDTDIPDVENKWKASSHWLAVVVIVMGSLCIAISVIELFQVYFGDQNA